MLFLFNIEVMETHIKDYVLLISIVKGNLPVENEFAFNCEI